METREIEIYTDGGCDSHLNGLGGWAYVVYEDGKIIKEEYGHEFKTTNNRMEIHAVKLALIYCLTHPKIAEAKFKIFSDSQYCVHTYNDWIFKWESYGWTRKPGGGEVKNLDQWQEVHKLRHPNIELIWIKGHNGTEGNERADFLSQLRLNHATDGVKRTIYSCRQRAEMDLKEKLKLMSCDEIQEYTKSEMFKLR